MLCIVSKIIIYKQESPNVDDKLVKGFPEPDPMNSLGGQRVVSGQVGEGVHQPLLVALLLGLYEHLDQLLVRVLVQADQYVQGGRAVGYEIAVDLVGEDQVEEELAH